MSRSDETEVLVIGAGPTGLLTALILAESGVGVKIVDKEYRTAAHSYACVLHPGTLQALSGLGLADEICALGRRIETMGFYEGEARRAEISFAELGGDFPFALVLPQSAFEDVLERQLQDRGGIKVLWNHCLQDLQFERNSVVASIDKLVQTAKGYIVADWDWTVQKRLETTASYVVGADGHNSMVRSRLGIDYESLGSPEQFAVFEFETDTDAGSEVRIAIDENTTNVLWPLAGNRCRWTFQLLKSTEMGDFPAKDREGIRFTQAQADEPIRHAIERLAQKRAPWFKRTVKEVQWSTRIQFGRWLAKQFGNGRTWLVGDAGHQTGPVAAQSMNVGLLEAVDLAGRLKKILSQGASQQPLEEYDHNRRVEWEQLLGKASPVGGAIVANPWVDRYKAKILPCLPASGKDVALLFDRLANDVAHAHAVVS